MVKILVIDNYDSFTFNLVHYIEQITHQKPFVFRNDEIELSDVKRFDKICISPGPGLPKDAGITMDVIANFGQTKPILGVCLGHQAIAEVYGSSLVNLPVVMHGIARKTLIVEDDYLFKNIPGNFTCGRYHSWVVQQVHDPLQTIAVDENQAIIAIRHTSFDVRGVQFHPESILTEYGITIMKNWIEHVH
jgi:anthranilate synthase component 2